MRRSVYNDFFYSLVNDSPFNIAIAGIPSNICVSKGVMRDEIKANFERGKGRRPWYPPLSHLHWIPAEVEESIRDRREEKEEEAKVSFII